MADGRAALRLSRSPPPSGPCADAGAGLIIARDPAAGCVLEMVADRREQVGDVVIVEAIADVPALALGDDEAKLAKDAQLVRDGAWLHPDPRGELFDREVLPQERE